ncbi:Lytic transglycosylase catalytic [Gluconacetobacter diazotrophicus PA1 5]|uniref:Lytic transglycosylase domain-containing protein n=2 Tax=Gluconacetobacter diazotrophicus TaxID=33996 RepID=A0A7W4FC34_GLUDI|nr:lytic transglycosylase domain-containing protein [Gluconacetobacter diazotrophicus]ACI51308.1 Lytic transglycosylase catalytic [Gluconacetobacter diazotrophicus PA1 5]MBB2154989.1 lytic transglycosylase domain-containing protein [Gluconacetobacter diazotrophicus]TWB09856.1 transglycosylase-like protein with SLT domain [Gluconacetobacter diazotrophicus]CAP54421.1 putative BfpH protein (involved in biogenesis of type IV pili) [Gluconacetobacter diazotrophicus PA1 5]
MGVAYLGCMALAATFYHLPPRVLPSIQAVESGRNGLVHHNANGTDDLGVMQVNTLWVIPIARFTNTPPPVVYRALLNDPCYNISAAGAVMRTYLNETHGDLMRAIGNYHSHTLLLNEAYQALVLSWARRLFRPPHPS